MAELMVYVKCGAVFCTFIHSMRLRFAGEKFRLTWYTSAEYWIAFLILILLGAVMIILTIIHYAYWEKTYIGFNYSKKGK